MRALILYVNISRACFQQFDCNANDRFAPAAFPTALLYNSLGTRQTVRMNTSAARAALGASATVDIYGVCALIFLQSVG